MRAAVARVQPKPQEKKVRMTLFVAPDVRKQLMHEAIDRDLSVGEIVTEAIALRSRVTTHGGP